MKSGNGLSDAYAATLTRLKAQKGNKSILGLKVLMWVLCSQRSLRAEELCHALGVEMGSVDLDPENVSTLRTLLASCLGLVTVEASSSTVRLVHFTLWEHLSSDPTLFRSPHSTIAEVCLTYLNFRQVGDLSPNLYSAPSTMPLLEYASYYWGEHTRRGMTENVKLLALRLLDRFDKHISAQLLLLRYDQDTISGPYFRGLGPTGFPGLHGVAFLGIVEIVTAVLEIKEWDVNAADCMGSTALTWAIRGGQAETVKVLLEREDINPNTADTQDGRTSLTLAAENGHEGLVKMLLGRQDIDPNMADTKYGRTPLAWAVRRGHEKVVKILLEREDVNADRADTQCGRAPILLAAERGHAGVVKMLLRREDVDPNTADTKYGRTPLLLATEYGHERVVKILLEQEDVNADQAGIQCGRTPLSLAAECGHERVVKMLLGRADINADRAGTQCGRTPLSWAAESGHAVVVKMLLEREDVNPNTTDTQYGRTPLSWAAENGNTGVIEVLLERKDVGTTPLDNKNQTPLSLALSKGHNGVVKILLERGNVDPDTRGHSGQSSFPPSAGNGDECVVEMRFRDDDLNTEAANLNGPSTVKKPAPGKRARQKSAAKEPKDNLTPSSEEIRKKLKDLIIYDRQGLQKVYRGTKAELDKSLQVPIQRGEEMARKLITGIGCGYEVAKELTVLTLYDVAILIGKFWC